VAAKLSVSLSGLIEVKRSGSGTFIPMPFLILPQSMMHARMVSESIALHTTISPEAIGRLPFFFIRSVMQAVSTSAAAIAEPLSVLFERVASMVLHLLTVTSEVMESPVVKPGWGQNFWGMLFIGFLLGLAIAVYFVFFKGEEEEEEEAELRKPPEEPPEQPPESIPMPVA